jgi:anaerobic selenocysteine-containing dehydrogenase
MQRKNGTLVPTDWDTANQEIGKAIRAIRKRHGTHSVGVYLGDEVQRSTRSLARGLAFGVGMGTPQIFSELCLGAGPRQWITEQMIGHAAPLLSDLGRAHYVCILGADPRTLGWGPMHPGMAMEQQIAHSRRTKGTKVVVADARSTPLAEAMDQHVPIRPGTEPFFLLGMLVAIVRGNWQDDQFVRDYTVGFDRLQAALGDWTVERCANICDVDPPALSGVALKFSRAAMAVAHLGHGALMNAHASLGAWAWLALHAVTANVLRPGGLYESRGAVDLFAARASIPSSGAPRTHNAKVPLLLMQAPATRLIEEMAAADSDRLRALVCVAGNPARTLAQPAQTERTLADLELLVCIARHEDETAQHADWVLPATHPWEQADLTLHDNGVLPMRGLMWTPPLVAAAGQARTPEAILRDLYRSARPGMRGSAWGRHLDLLSRTIVHADLEGLEHRILEWSQNVDLRDVPAGTRRLHLGDADRATWRLTTDDERIQLVPFDIEAALSSVQPPSPREDMPFLLRTSRPRDRAPDRWHRDEAANGAGVHVHPDAGLADGARVQVRTAFGHLNTQVRHDPALRPDTAELAPEHHPDGLVLCDAAAVDPMCGVPLRDGLPCAVEPV